MRALLVDDDPSLRMMMRRLLGREFSIDCLEAENGISALDILGRTPVDFVALDIRMPLMDGQDVLTVLRRSPDLRDLPVVVMSTLDDDDTVHKIVSLGISDYLLKPFNLASIRNRFAHVVKSCQVKRQHRPIKISPTSRVLVADGDRQYVELLSSLLCDFCEVHTAMDGIDAFRQAVRRNDYAALFVGEELGLLGRDLLVTGLRAESATRYIPLVGIGASDGESDPYDAVLPRSFAADVVRDGLALLLGNIDSPRTYLQARGAMAIEASAAVTQALGMLTQCDLRPVPGLDVDDVECWASASVDLVSAHVGLTAEVLCPMTHARLLAGARVGRGVYAVGEEQALELLGDTVGTLAARLAMVLGRRGHAVDCSPVRRRVMSTTGGWPNHGRSPALLTTLQSSDLAVSLGVRLTWLGAEHERAAAARDAAGAAMV